MVVVVERDARNAARHPYVLACLGLLGDAAAVATPPNNFFRVLFKSFYLFAHVCRISSTHLHMLCLFSENANVLRLQLKASHHTLNLVSLHLLIVSEAAYLQIIAATIHHQRLSTKCIVDMNETWCWGRKDG